jgi:hypothetical protein
MNFKISQSFLKEFSKYLKGETCGLQVKAKYIDKISFPPFSKVLNLGNYFEFMATGALPRDGKIPAPVIVYKGTAKESLSEDYMRANASAEFFQEIVNHYSIEILDKSVDITVGKKTGIMDVVAKFNNRVAIIDLKYSGLLEDKWNDLGWETESLQYKDNIMVQAIHYTTLLAEKMNIPYSDVDFYFFVFHAKDERNAKIIKVNIDEDAFESHNQAVESVYHEVVVKKHVFKAKPKLDLCNKCPLLDCPERIKVPLIENVYYSI